MNFSMNPQRGRHLQGEEQRPEESGNKPSIFIHSHSGGHTMHVFHSDGGHEMHEHGHEAQSVGEHVKEALGGGESDTHEHDAGAGAVTE
jgi:hypothetical protein